MTHFLFLVITAVVWYYAGPPLLVIAAFVGFIWLWASLCRRFPASMFFLTGFLSGLLGGGRRRW